MKQSRSCKSSAFFVFIFFSLVVLSASGQRGARTVPRSLDQLTQESTTIVRGYVISAKVEPDPQLKNLMTVVVSMKVESTLKGSASSTLQFRQYIWDIRDQYNKAGYAKGQELLLLLGPVSQYGLRSPVGLEQGRFAVIRDKTGKATAVNGVANAGLFDHVETRTQKQGIQLSARAMTMIRRAQPGPVALEDLEDAIRTLGRAK